MVFKSYIQQYISNEKKEFKQVAEVITQPILIKLENNKIFDAEYNINNIKDAELIKEIEIDYVLYGSPVGLLDNGFNDFASDYKTLAGGVNGPLLRGMFFIYFYDFVPCANYKL